MSKIKNLLEKFFIFFISLVIIGAFGTSKVFAQTTATQSATTSTPTNNDAPGPWYNQSFQQWHTKVYDTNNPQEIFGERYTAAQVQWIIYSLFSFTLHGGDNNNSEMLSCVMTKGADGCTDLVDKFQKQLNAGSNQTSINNSDWKNVFTSRPLSGIGYLAGIGTKLHLIPEAKAQGFGFTAGGDFVLNIWKITRNISYALLTIVVVAFAFMIMFKVKINPQTVVSIQSSLPKVVIAIILITFSYAIAGFLIDIMYVVVGLLCSLFTSSIINGQPIFNDSFPKLFSYIASGENIIGLGIRYWWGFVITMSATLLFGSGSLALPPGVFVLAIINFVIVLVATISLLIIIVMTIITLIQTFVRICLLIIISPLQILMGTIVPENGFGKWLRNMAASLAVYPVIIFLFFLAFIALSQSLAAVNLPSMVLPFNINRVQTGTIWSPPLTVGNGQNMQALLYLILSFGLIMIVPRVSKLIESLLQGKPFEGMGIGEALAPAKWAMNQVAVMRLETLDRQLEVAKSKVGDHSDEIERIMREINTYKRFSR